MQECFVTSLAKVDPVVLEKKIFKFHQYFHSFVIFSPLNRSWYCIWTHLNLLHAGMLCAKFSWNWPCGSWEEDWLNFINLFSLFCYFLPWKRACFHLNKLYFHSSKDTLHQVWWNWSSGSGEEEKIVKKIMTRWQRQCQRWATDKLWSEKLTWALSVFILHVKRNPSFSSLCP